MLDFERDGIMIAPSVLTDSTMATLKADISLDSEKLAHYGIRNLEKRFTSIALLVNDPVLLSIANQLLHGRAQLVRALFFDKTPRANWYVTWHQDKTVTLNKQIDLPGWKAWSRKDSIYHVQPPLAVLNTMVTFRLHLDDANETNGCLFVIPKSHQYGLLNPNQIQTIVRSQSKLPCCVAAGDAVVMRPHILHASYKAEQPAHRRVVHIEYSSYALPEGVCWA